MHGSFDHGLDFATMLRGGEGESHQALVPSRALFEIPDVDIFLGVFEGIGRPGQPVQSVQAGSERVIGLTRPYHSCLCLKHSAVLRVVGNGVQEGKMAKKSQVWKMSPGDAPTPSTAASTPGPGVVWSSRKGDVGIKGRPRNEFDRPGTVPPAHCKQFAKRNSDPTKVNSCWDRMNGGDEDTANPLATGEHGVLPAALCRRRRHSTSTRSYAKVVLNSESARMSLRGGNSPATLDVPVSIQDKALAQHYSKVVAAFLALVLERIGRRSRVAAGSFQRPGPAVRRAYRSCCLYWDRLARCIACASGTAPTPPPRVSWNSLRVRLLLLLLLLPPARTLPRRRAAHSMVLDGKAALPGTMYIPVCTCTLLSLGDRHAACPRTGLLTPGGQALLRSTGSQHWLRTSALRPKPIAAAFNF
ncbi:hypothetical protein AK812_SmicGene32613 [Symbiodinium microadriaticum]|uniref:Uncharacterized protein n=1 Tax=Symbiodinium microadriaticum TaxID=2951 RepID=A0A1Q9CTT4_SYMMI|nr:hypothetical protein AK812_SmicGene32613 [Symbiodinium microadriaticum]